MQIVVRPAAAADIDAAFLWYEGQRPSLGHEFLAAAQTVVDAITSIRSDIQLSAVTPGERFCVAFRTLFISESTETPYWSSHVCMVGEIRGDGRYARDG